MKIFFSLFYILITCACHKNSSLSPGRTLHAPFTYSTQKVLGVRKKPLQPVHPTFKGGRAHHCVSEPLLPKGLELSPDCVISGTPLFASSKQTYTLTASIGNSQFSTAIEITVQPNIRELVVGAGAGGITFLTLLLNHKGASAYALLEDGTVMAWGRNDYGQLGIGNSDRQNTPQIIRGLGKVKNLVANDSAAYALLEDGTVWAWGKNKYGQLGIGNNLVQTAPQLVEGL